MLASARARANFARWKAWGKQINKKCSNCAIESALARLPKFTREDNDGNVLAPSQSTDKNDASLCVDFILCFCLVPKQREPISGSGPSCLLKSHLETLWGSNDFYLREKKKKKSDICCFFFLLSEFVSSSSLIKDSWPI